MVAGSIVGSMCRCFLGQAANPDRAAEPSKAKQELREPGPTLLGNLRAHKDAKGDQKKKPHIVWNVGDREITEKSEGGVSVPTTPGLRQTSHSVHSLDAVEFPLDDSLAHAAFEDGQRVEYFSVMNRVWMVGTVHTDVAISGGHHPQPYMRYDVTLSNGQLREDVGLEVLRSPFRSGEPVEFSSGQEVHLRLAGVIDTDQWSAPSMLGYRVVIEETAQSFTNIPLLRLKRRFPRGSYAEVYRGTEIGWQMAKVHHTASADGCEAECLPLPTLPGSVAAGTGLLAHADAELTPRAVPQSVVSTLGIWTAVPICQESEILGIEAEEDATPEYVPSYLLRTLSYM